MGGVGWSGVEWRVPLKSSELRLSDTDSVSHEEEGGAFSVKGEGRVREGKGKIHRADSGQIFSMIFDFKRNILLKPSRT